MNREGSRKKKEKEERHFEVPQRPLSFVTATYPQIPNPSATSGVKLVLTSLCAYTTTKPTPRHFVVSVKFPCPSLVSM